MITKPFTRIMFSCRIPSAGMHGSRSDRRRLWAEEPVFEMIGEVQILFWQVTDIRPGLQSKPMWWSIGLLLATLNWSNYMNIHNRKPSDTKIRTLCQTVNILVTTTKIVLFANCYMTVFFHSAEVFFHMKMQLRK